MELCMGGVCIIPGDAGADSAADAAGDGADAARDGGPTDAAAAD
jgi:hypothetical protein